LLPREFGFFCLLSHFLICCVTSLTFVPLFCTGHFCMPSHYMPSSMLLRGQKAFTRVQTDGSTSLWIFSFQNHELSKPLYFINISSPGYFAMATQSKLTVPEPILKVQPLQKLMLFHRRAPPACCTLSIFQVKLKCHTSYFCIFILLL
jgi:hypothetical protein